MSNEYIYYVIYKPYNSLSQFSPEGPGDVTLAQLYAFEKDVYPVGRLDKDSEGMLIITNDKHLTEYLLNPENGHTRQYWVQVEGIFTEDAAEVLRDGVDLIEYTTRKAKIEVLAEQPPGIPDRVPPIRFRKTIPTSWAQLVLVEGKNRQVRKMTAHVNFPTLRLIRVGIGGLRFKKMVPGSVKKIPKEIIYKAIENPTEIQYI